MNAGQYRAVFGLSEEDACAADEYFLYQLSLLVVYTPAWVKEYFWQVEDVIDGFVPSRFPPSMWEVRSHDDFWRGFDGQ